MTTWVSDSRGNKCAVEYFGSKEKAQEALDSLEDCDNCINCSDCSDCSGCSHVAFIHNKENKQGDPDSDSKEFIGAPTIPIIENIHQKIYDAVSQPRALEMGNWHTCNTTHYRGGWVVHLAGEEGYKLERFHNTALAAQLIYSASGYEINPCRFYDGNEEAMADMKKLAGIE